MTGVADGLRHRPLVFVRDLLAPELDDADLHHLQGSLRLRPGSEITVGDGSGGWRVCRLAPRPDPVGELQYAGPPPARPTVAFTPVKAERPEWVVQKLTEVGVARILLLEAERSVVRWDTSRAARNLDRCRRVAREASMQSRRLWLPEVQGPLLARDVLAAGLPVAEPGGRPPAAGDAGLVVGPEGGWSPSELAVVPDRVVLPGGILRAGTAAVVAGAVLVGLRDGVLAPTRPGTGHAV